MYALTSSTAIFVFLALFPPLQFFPCRRQSHRPLTRSSREEFGCFVQYHVVSRDPFRNLMPLTLDVARDCDIVGDRFLTLFSRCFRLPWFFLSFSKKLIFDSFAVTDRWLVSRVRFLFLCSLCKAKALTALLTAAALTPVPTGK